MKPVIGLSLGLVIMLALLMDVSESLPQAPLGKQSFVDIPTAQVLEYMGWQTETYEVKSNGYLLRLTRMINPLAGNQSGINRTILFSHGLLHDSVDDFLSFAEYVRPEAPTNDSYGTDLYANEDSHLDPFNQATHRTYSRMCLPCLFSNNNYDVWLLDSRGTSRGSLQVADPRLEDTFRYWNFTIDDQALDDLPNVMDYMLNVTGLEKLSYVGYSLGTLHMNMLLSAVPQWADKIEAYVSIAPIAYLGSILGVMRILCSFGPFTLDINGPDLSYDQMVALNSVVATIFENPLSRTTVFRSFQASVGGPEPDINILTQTFLDHSHQPNSMKVFAQVAELVETNKFQRFDYGTAERNMAAYGESDPPQYDPGAIRLKKIIRVRSVGNDWLSRPNDHNQFDSALTVPLFKDIITPDSYNHFSFFTAKDAFTKVFKPVLNAVNEAYLTKLD